MPGPILVLLVGWLTVVVVGGVATGWSWPTLVRPAVVPTTGTLDLTMHHGRRPRA